MATGAPRTSPAQTHSLDHNCRVLLSQAFIPVAHDLDEIFMLLWHRWSVLWDGANAGPGLTRGQSPLTMLSLMIAVA